MSTRILAVETATHACSAALLIGDEVREQYRVAPREHATILLPMIETLMQEAGLRPEQLDAVAFGCGPGSFTGLRIAASAAQGVAFSAGLPVAPVSTLAAVALSVVREGYGQVRVALDARMQEVYWGVYTAAENGLVSLGGVEQVCAPADVTTGPDGDWVAAGDGWGRYGPQLRARCGGEGLACFPEQYPHAADVARLANDMHRNGRLLPAAQAQPVYLRDNVASKPRSGGRSPV